MNRLVVGGIASTLIGCSSVGAHSHAQNASEVSAGEAELTSLRVQNEEQEQELRMLRSQLALARAELQELRAGRNPEPTLSTEVSASDALPWTRNGKDGNLDLQPVLRLDGVIVDERLPVTAQVPALPDFASPEPTKEPGMDSSIQGYRRGLSLVREQRFEEALIALEEFASEHPSHPYTDNALFWCGEIHYLRREYDGALRDFERIEKLYPWGNKAPDALYRMGQIYLRRGDTARAQSYFNKVREQFPDTAAARLASREDAS